MGLGRLLTCPWPYVPQATPRVIQMPIPPLGGSLPSPALSGFLSPPGFSSCLSPPLSHVLPRGRGWHPVGPSRHTLPGTVKAKAARLVLSFSWESQLLRKVTGVCSRKGVFAVGPGTMLGSIPSVQGAPWCRLLTAPGTSRIKQAAGWDRLAAQTVWPRGVGRGVRQLREHVPSCEHHSLPYERHSAGPGLSASRPLRAPAGGQGCGV